MNKILGFLIVLVFCFGVLSFAQSSTPSPGTTPAFGNIVSGVNSASNKVPSGIPAAVIMLITFILTEAAAHGIPTSKPISWFLGLNAILAALILLLQKVQTLCQTLGNSLQNTNGPQ